MIRFILTVLLGMVLGAGATLYYIYENHADASERAMMRSTLLDYAPFLEEYVTP
ncbi:hypothetical protein [Yoonia sp.]|uniref:hypothetical protein n=1 Tax=Yoonia sp. TaxID=2212373 RepID=UPI0019E82240|nr:hypothetical protein [Yoonia sp.]MBE0413434.1 hypothetical protein [Yoonia sp.]